ncbi:MAG: hypothetical protein EBZ48_17945, partial [Proteobacteria bacterium]|nr:hypothetical protein [Pseudomonadota bacterium]
GDLVLVQARETGSSSVNRYAVCTVQSVLGQVLTFSRVVAPYSAPSTSLTVDGSTYYYTILRPSAVQLFAVPGSGPTGQEQTFLAVRPSTTLHNALGPTTDQINQDRVLNLVPPTASGSLDRDRSDAVYGSPAPSLSCEGLGYRVVLYPDNGAGTPDLTKPIASLNPVIDPAIPADDQRFTIDYRAGVIRFSCAPALGGDIKVAGGVNPTTGRLNLYAVFMAFDQTQTQGTARGLYGVRTLNYGREPARIVYDQTTDSWRLTQNEQGDDLFTQAVGPDTDYRRQVKIGALSTGSVEGYFVYDIDRNRWRFANHSSVVGTDPAASMEMEVGQKTALTVGDISAPPLAPADL